MLLLSPSVVTEETRDNTALTVGERVRGSPTNEMRSSLKSSLPRLAWLQGDPGAVDDDDDAKDPSPSSDPPPPHSSAAPTSERWRGRPRGDTALGGDEELDAADGNLWGFSPLSPTMVPWPACDAVEVAMLPLERRRLFSSLTMLCRRCCSWCAPCGLVDLRGGGGEEGWRERQAPFDDAEEHQTDYCRSTEHGLGCAWYIYRLYIHVLCSCPIAQNMPPCVNQ